jgi:hypothetical protein
MLQSTVPQKHFAVLIKEALKEEFKDMLYSISSLVAGLVGTYFLSQKLVWLELISSYKKWLQTHILQLWVYFMQEGLS